MTLKLGKRVCKTVTLSKFGDQDSGEVRHRELRLTTFQRNSDRTFDFSAPEQTIYVEDDQIEALTAFLDDELLSSGRFRIVDARSPAADILDLLDGRQDSAFSIVQALASSQGEVVSAALEATEAGLTIAEGAVLRARRRLVERAIEQVRDAGCSEGHMQTLIGGAWWIFGGRYTGIVPRRQILQLDEHDIPLVCSDGSLHIVELKGPVVPTLVKHHRNHWIVGKDVHEAVMQATNYIRTADELGLSTMVNLRDELGIDVDLRRTFATVVIGHRDHLEVDGLPDGQLDVALRTYNASLSRVQVITYDQLLDSALRAMTFA